MLRQAPTLVNVGVDVNFLKPVEVATELSA